MKKAGLLLGFLPLIIYGIFAGQSVVSVEIALVLSLLAGIIPGYQDLRRHFILAWTTVIVFGLALFGIGVLNVTLFIPFMGVLIYATLAIVAFTSILFNCPFTIQYARTMVDSSLWKNPVFIRVNVFMTGAWGSIFIINLVLSLFIVYIQGPLRFFIQIATYIFLIAGIIFTVTYPDYVRKRVVPLQPQSVLELQL